VNHDPHVQRAYDAALAILEEAGYVNGVVLICEIDAEGLTVALDDDRVPIAGLPEFLRRAAAKIEAGEAT
jgi:predicted deacylase